MKLGNGKANQPRKAAWVPAAMLAMTTVSAALQTSAPAPPSPKAPEFAKATVRWVLVSIPDRKLALFANGKVVRIYRVAVGKTSTPSPAGEFKIVNRVTNPTYYHKGQVIGAGKGNPVGTRWMGLSAKGYGIHGTNHPNSIGKSASTGCIRMGKQDLEELFASRRRRHGPDSRGTRRADRGSLRNWNWSRRRKPDDRAGRGRIELQRTVVAEFLFETRLASSQSS